MSKFLRVVGTKRLSKRGKPETGPSAVRQGFTILSDAA
jgi:hypothetical protein